MRAVLDDTRRPTFAALLAACPLAAGPFERTDRRCDWCGTTLEGRRTRWCSDPCANAFGRNHYWTNARAAALERDRCCRRCGRDGTTPDLDAWLHVLRVLCPPPPAPNFSSWAREHGYALDSGDGHREAWRLWHTAVHRIRAPWFAAQAIVDVERAAHRLEVNHVTPVLGRHAVAGCHHHLEGLEVLCRPCHLAETARQRAAGELRRPD